MCPSQKILPQLTMLGPQPLSFQETNRRGILTRLVHTAEGTLPKHRCSLDLCTDKEVSLLGPPQLLAQVSLPQSL